MEKGVGIKILFFRKEFLRKRDDDLYDSLRRNVLCER